MSGSKWKLETGTSLVVSLPCGDKFKFSAGEKSTTIQIEKSDAFGDFETLDEVPRTFIKTLGVALVDYEANLNPIVVEPPKKKATRKGSTTSRASRGAGRKAGPRAGSASRPRRRSAESADQ